MKQMEGRNQLPYKQDEIQSILFVYVLILLTFFKKILRQYFSIHVVGLDFSTARTHEITPQIIQIFLFNLFVK